MKSNTRKPIRWLQLLFFFKFTFFYSIGAGKKEEKESLAEGKCPINALEINSSDLIQWTELLEVLQFPLMLPNEGYFNVWHGRNQKFPEEFTN